MRITQKILEEKAKETENFLQEQGFNVTLKKYWAYGMYSYYFNFINPADPDPRTNLRQVWTMFGTKKETMDNLTHTQYRVLAQADWFKFEDRI